MAQIWQSTTLQLSYQTRFNVQKRSQAQQPRNWFRIYLAADPIIYNKTLPLSFKSGEVIWGVGKRSRDEGRSGRQVAPYFQLRVHLQGFRLWQSTWLTRITRWISLKTVQTASELFWLLWRPVQLLILNFEVTDTSSIHLNSPLDLLLGWTCLVGWRDQWQRGSTRRELNGGTAL